MDHGRTDLLGPCPDPADQEGGQAVADVDTDDDGKHTAEIQSHSRGQGLKDTDHGRGALNDACNHYAGQKAQQVIVLEGCQQGAEPVSHVGDGRPHVDKAHKEDAETGGNAAYGSGFVPFDEHDADHADEQGHGGQVIGLEEVEEAGGACIQIHQPDDLGRDGRTYVGAKDNAHGLAEGQKARSHQAYRKNDGSRGRLDHTGDQHAEEKADGRPVGNLGQGCFHSPARRALEAVAHHPHSVQEHGKAAQKGYHFIENIHKNLLFYIKHLQTGRSVSFELYHGGIIRKELYGNLNTTLTEFNTNLHMKDGKKTFLTGPKGRKSG